MEAYIYDSLRTPRGRGNKKGALVGTTATQLVVTVMDELRKRHNLDTTQVEDMILGCVTQIMDQGANVAKTAAQHSGYGEHLTAVTLNRFCGSGLEAINQAAAYIKSGFNDLMLAGGVESMSRVKIGLDGGAIAMDPTVALPGHFVPQGISADLIATKYGYSRNDADKFALESQKRAAKAWAENAFEKSIVPIRDINDFLVLDKDENVRPSTTLEGLGSLKPAFEKMGQMGGFDAVAIDRYPEVEAINHVHHAGNSSAIVDGAALTLIGNQLAGERLGLKPRARIKSVATYGTDPTIMLVGPAPASRKALQKAGMSKNDIDLFEVNEAFASVALRFMDDLDIDHAKVNVNGGAIALGHPLGATGCMLVGTALDELERRGLSTALITLCIGGGMGIATIIERV
ncbi:MULTISPECIES: acetyl-CoA C-acetyltransferase [unclassified Aureispira]|uniref:acetyl-CoA C-acetyltransferase n=1 Tax=unclassified Aureispira TaxID=2649989 RepID=UPI000697A696|nr:MULTISPECIES: acetyl-CoA C-acetyltransferase [unclassified Aureispira]WMX12595.1 acetyl-CoA C-acetyltransferase [Aureispira sp. CCB-E]